jgi:hypothetical protein
VRRTLPFGLHQLLELILGLALIGLSIHVDDPFLLVVTGAVFAVMALCSEGRMGILKLIPRRVHAALDIAVPVAVAIAPVVPALRPDLTGIICLELAALAWLRIATLTRYRPAPIGSDAVGAPSPGATPTPSASPGPSPAPAASVGAQPPPTTPERAGGDERAPVTPDRVVEEIDRMVTQGSRRLGRMAGSLARAYTEKTQKRG